MKSSTATAPPLKQLQLLLGERLVVEKLYQQLYATDASVYQEYPLGVTFPKNETELVAIVKICQSNSISIIPRGAGTSLAGQCVGTGLVIDVSRYMNNIIAFDKAAKTVTVEPGINRNALNKYLSPDRLFFAPITSTANRATIGGMIGNNSCGTNSIMYGDCRKYVKAIDGILDDGSRIHIQPLTKAALKAKLALNNREGAIYKKLVALLNDKNLAQDIAEHFPKSTVTRRNTAYALDALYASFSTLENGGEFNLAPLIAGSEGTLLFITSVTLDLQPLPPAVDVLVVCSFSSVHKSMKAVYDVMQHQPYACELMDKTIMNCTRKHPKYAATLDYFTGSPEAVLIVELRGETIELATSLAKKLIADLESKQHAYEHFILSGAANKAIWELRSAGLGLLANTPGDKKGVACIEDTAVAVEDLADYIADFSVLMDKFDQEVVYYAHAGAGEIHLRPFLDLKRSQDRQHFYDISLAVARLVKKYKGSLSGEHGDGRVRAPFLPMMIGQANYQRCVAIKKAFDPNHIFNPKKIVGAAAMNEDLRYQADMITPAFDTVFDFSATQGILRMAEKCNGSGDCRKLTMSKGTMCPSFQVSLDERDSTRGRANILRQVLTENAHQNPFDHPHLSTVLDLCVSCKACTSECPSNVNMAMLKAEVTHQHQKKHGIPLRSRLFSNIGKINKIGSWTPRLTNAILTHPISSKLLKNALGISKQRSLPRLASTTFEQYYRKFKPSSNHQRSVYLFCDTFTNYNDSNIGKKALELLDNLGYNVKMIKHPESGRAAISKGVLDMAKQFAIDNVRRFSPIVNQTTPLVGIEPSAILSFRDEYPNLVGKKLKKTALKLANNCLTIEEFLVREIKAFNIKAAQFDQKARNIVVHGHCHQKALTDFKDIFTLLALPNGHKVRLLDSGCCGMAGSFGYESEHYEMSMQIGQLKLFPELEQSATDTTIVVASGTSCRHQIKDGLNRQAYHALEVLWEALIKA